MVTLACYIHINKTYCSEVSNISVILSLSRHFLQCKNADSLSTCSTCQKEEKECIWVKYLIYAVLLRFQICRNLRVFSAKSVFPKFQSSQNNVFFPSLTGRSLKSQQHEYAAHKDCETLFSS